MAFPRSFIAFTYGSRNMRCCRSQSCLCRSRTPDNRRYLLYVSSSTVSATRIPVLPALRVARSEPVDGPLWSSIATSSPLQPAGVPSSPLQAPQSPAATSEHGEVEPLNSERRSTQTRDPVLGQQLLWADISFLDSEMKALHSQWLGFALHNGLLC